MFAVKPKVNLVLDTLILLAFVVALVSGLLAFGGGGGSGRTLHGGRGAGTAEMTTHTTAIAGSTHGALDDLHLISGLLAGALVAVHLLFHFKWITCQVRKLFEPAGRDTHTRSGSQPHAIPRARPGVQ